MEAIEFQTTLGNDDIISIPHGLGKKVKRGSVHVIIIGEPQPFFDRDEANDRDLDRARDYLDYLMENPIKVDKTKPFLTRDELHDRRL